jgi:hypothetical protein
MIDRIRGLGVGAALPVLLAWTLLGAASPARAQSLKDQLVGHWQLVSINIADTAPYGSAPQGSMFLDAAGHYSVIIVTGGDARSVGYFGTYTLDEAGKTITLHVVAGTRPNAAGRDETRQVTLSGNQLVLQRLPSTGPAAALGTVKLTWQRAE